MSISFNNIPTTGRVPFLYAEFDSSKAQQGPSLKQYKALVMAQKLPAGSAVSDVPVLVTSENQAIQLFGRGSFAHRMVKQFLANNKFNALYVIPQTDNGAGVAAAGAITLTGPATAAGTLQLYVGGVVVSVPVTSGDSATVMAANAAAAINALLDLPVTATSAAGVVTVTCRHKGTLGNDIDLRVNYQLGDATPAGVGVTFTAMSGGATNPVLTTSIANMTERQYDIVAFPYTDATSLTAIENELEDRWGPVRQNDGRAISVKSDTLSNLATFGLTRNSKQVSIVGVYKYPTPTFELCAMISAVACYYLQQDPARPLQTLPLIGALQPAAIDEFRISDRNLLLHDGIATLRHQSGVVQIERLITTYQLNAAGASDVAYLDINTLATLSYLRWDWRNTMLTKYPRSKLANDGTRYGAGQAIITPKQGRAEAIAKFREWEDLGLVEGADQFKRDLIVERNAGDVNRLDFFLPPDLVNQLMVIGTQFGFLL